ncbi:MAG TPA: hypothetical protein IAD08_06770 [Candidatus Scatovivens faecipullorum]|jgi:membrane protein|nr:hypothetical protein [Candidatus Scatovivens faecipullorum]
MADNEKFSVDTEQLKNETKETVNQVKSSIKNVNFKQDAEETKGFVKEMFSNPFEAVRRVATEEENVFKKVIFLMIIFIAASVISQIISLIKYGRLANVGSNIMDLIVSVLNPILYILVPAVIILIFNKQNKKSLITIISTVVVAGIPTICNEVINIIERILPGISIITSPITTVLSAIALILTYFGIKDLLGIEDHKDSIKKYAIIKLISAFVLVILGRIGIY